MNQPGVRRGEGASHHWCDWARPGRQGQQRGVRRRLRGRWSRRWWPSRRCRQAFRWSRSAAC